MIIEVVSAEEDECSGVELVLKEPFSDHWIYEAGEYDLNEYIQFSGETDTCFVEAKYFTFYTSYDALYMIQNEVLYFFPSESDITGEFQDTI